MKRASNICIKIRHLAPRSHFMVFGGNPVKKEMPCLEWVGVELRTERLERVVGMYFRQLKIPPKSIKIVLRAISRINLVVSLAFRIEEAITSICLGDCWIGNLLQSLFSHHYTTLPWFHQTSNVLLHHSSQSYVSSFIWCMNEYLVSWLSSPPPPIQNPQCWTPPGSLLIEYITSHFSEGDMWKHAPKSSYFEVKRTFHDISFSDWPFFRQSRPSRNIFENGPKIH